MDNSSYVEALVNFESDIQKIFGSPSPNRSVEMDSPVLISGSSSSDADEKQPLSTIRKKRNTNTRRPAYRPEYMPGLRIFRTDVRRRYGEMYVNVTNSQDPKLISQFFYQFCRPDCSYITRFAEGCKFGEIASSLFPGSKEDKEKERNVNRVIAGSLAFLALFPDSVIRLLKFEVRVQKGIPGSVLIATLNFQGSFMYNIFHHSSNRGNVQKDIPSNAVEFIGPNYTTNEKVYLSLLPQPIPVRFKCIVRMDLDDQHRIVSFTSFPMF